MDQSQRDLLGQMITATALYYRQDIPKSVISMYIDDLIDAGISFEDASSAYKTYRRNPKNSRFPIPANIIEIIRPQISPDAEATAASARIYQAISKFGYCNPMEAKVFIGSLGWSVVQRMGGWVRICESVGVDYDKSAFLAHAKAIAKAESEYSLAGLFNTAPALPHEKRSEGLISAGEILHLSGPVLKDLKEVSGND